MVKIDEKQIKKEREFEEEIKKLEKRIDREGFKKLEVWLGEIETYPIKENRTVLFIRKRPYILFFLAIIIISFLLPLIYFPYVATISAILIFFSILPCCPTIRIPPNLEHWLNRHPNVSNALIWEFPAPEGSYVGVPLKYSEWNSTMKWVLQMAFESAWNFNIYESLRIVDPPPNHLDLEDDDPAVTLFDGVHASHLYIAYVAHCLAIEIKGVVRWSVLNYNSEELEILFDGRHMFQWIQWAQGYIINSDRNGNAIPAPPDFTFFFFLHNNLLKSNRKSTIVSIINWSRDNLIHYSGGRTALNMESQWQYRGNPPVSRMINGTIYAYHPEWGLQHITAGCWGTLGFFRSIFRAVNIPVKKESHDGHAQPYFISEGVYLSHGDDPYHGLAKATPLPVEENNLVAEESLLPHSELLLTNQAKYNKWFIEGDKTVGLRLIELAIEYLPDSLLHSHCEDLNEGRPHADSHVYKYTLRRVYSVDFLEAQNLWSRMESKIATWGGCDVLPDAHSRTITGG